MFVLHPSQPIPINWVNLPDSEQLNLISYFDLSTRRALRCCSLLTKELVETVPYRKLMDLKCLRNWSKDGTWICEHNSSHGYGGVQKEIFKTRQAAYQRMEELIRTAETIEHFMIDLEPGSICSLVNGNKLVNVKSFSLTFRRGFDKQTNGSYNRLLKQLNPDYLEGLRVHVRELPLHRRKMIREHILDLESTTFLNLRKFFFDGHLNDQQFLALSAPTIKMGNGSGISPATIVEFFQETILQTYPRKSLYLDNINSGLQMYLFGRLLFNEADEPFYLVFNTVYPDWKVLFVFFELDDGIDMMDKSVNLEINFIEDDNIFDVYSEIEASNNYAVVKQFPCLTRLLRAVSAALPSDFHLLCTEAFLHP